MRYRTTPLVLLPVLLLGETMQLRAEIDFNRDIRPILSENCVHCHGPEGGKKRKAGLRLDTREGATAEREGVRAIVPGEPSRSALWHRIRSEDPDELMPPPESKRSLTRKQAALLEQWIEAGAEYDTHWAWKPPVRPAGTLDQLVAAHRPLPASPPADRRTLIRRVSLDLVGLPPTPAEVRAFLGDDAPGAWERVVDRLLASPRFGERWARPWLDLARYADSNGFQADQLRDSWAYRDWVIDALNANMPFDRFSIEQLAGDLLPNATLNQKIATGFHRTVTCNVEAGVHPEENRVNQVFDRVNTTGTTWLGLTLECAQCHDHKYDPLSQRDYYRLFAYFNNTPVEVRNPSGKGVSFDFYGPKMDLPLAPRQQAEREALLARKTSLAAERDALKSQPRPGLDAWIAAHARAGAAPGWQGLEVIEVKSNRDDTHRVLEDGSVLFGGNVPDTVIHTFRVKTPLRGIRAIRVDALTHPSLPGTGPGRGDVERTNFILSEFGVRVRTTGDGTFSKVPLAGTTADFSQGGWPVKNAIDGDRKTGWAVAPQFKQPHWAAFRTRKPLGEAGIEELQITLDQNYGRGRVLGRVRLSATTSEPAGEVPAAVAKLLATPRDSWTKAQHEQVEAAWRDRNPRLREIADALARVEKDLKRISPATTLVMVEQEETRTTRIMNRGNYLDPKERVAPGTPALLHPLPADVPPNRLGFARWLVRRDNPLTARVTVNRWWAELFGRGLVETLEDFGTQSTPPTHPELLDWLAVDFMDNGWDMKHVLRTIVLSETYRQDSRQTADHLDRDPENKFYARAPRFRLDAETIRDNGLTVSGLLDTTMHGRPIMPYQPPGMWRQVGRNEPKWQEQKDGNRWRRGIYIVFRRAAPYPSLVNFDAPDRAACTVRRGRTNTPLQALTLLNDPAWAEMALALADRVLVEAPPDRRLDHLYECVLARPPSDGERAWLEHWLAERLGRFRAAPKDATNLVTGTRLAYSPRHPDPVDLAAWFHLANALLNLDETMTRE